MKLLQTLIEWLSPSSPLGMDFLPQSRNSVRRRILTAETQAKVLGAHVDRVGGLGGKTR